MGTDNAAIVKRFIDEVWNNGRMNVVDELVANNVVMQDPLGVQLRGSDALKQFVSNFRAGFPDMRLSVENIMTSGDNVFLRWTATGTHKGSFLGIAPTNKRVTVGGMTVDRLQGGKVSETWNAWDVLTFMQQLGLLPTMDKIAAGGMASQPSQPVQMR